jgi:ISXO2-like transposase domain
MNGTTLRPILTAHLDFKSALMTDTAGGYLHVGKSFARHEMVDHGALEYVHGEAHSNMVENYFSILKAASWACIMVLEKPICTAI